MIHLSPSNLVAFQQLQDPNCPWMTPEKFRNQFLGLEPFSDAADAGNAVHDAAFQNGPVEGTWGIDPELVNEIQKLIPAPGVPEASFVLPGEAVGIKSFDCRLSMRFDLLSPGCITELKTSKHLVMERYLSGAQLLSYRVAMKTPVLLIGAEVKISKPRGRPKDCRGMIEGVWVTAETSQYTPEADEEALRLIWLQTIQHVLSDAEMHHRATNRELAEAL